MEHLEFNCDISPEDSFYVDLGTNLAIGDHVYLSVSNESANADVCLRHGKVKELHEWLGAWLEANSNKD